jgi:hypothetical protein
MDFIYTEDMWEDTPIDDDLDLTNDIYPQTSFVDEWVKYEDYNR